MVDDNYIKLLYKLANSFCCWI